MLNSAEHELLNAHKYKKKSRNSALANNAIFPAHKCKNANTFWHFNINELSMKLCYNFGPNEVEFSG